jgi:TM2 domain-containing membrane protein YozV
LWEATLKNSIKGALFSGLIFPGLGQIILKRSQRGVAILLTVLISVSIMAVKIVAIARDSIDKIASEGGMMDASKISEIASQVSTDSTEFMLNFLLLVILACWLFSIFDAYRIGRKMDAEGDTSV